MSLLLASILVGLLCGSVNGYSANDYALYFSDKGVTDYASIWGMRSLTRFTVCFWMKSTATNEGTPFSYAVPGRDNELTFLGYGNFRLYVGHKSSIVHESANDGRWHHICASWSSYGGTWHFYKDGELHMYSRGLRRGYTITAGGSLVLGQEQSSCGGGFDPEQSFLGYLTNVNVWSYVLSGSTIKSLSKSCLSGEGNVYKWSDFIHGVKGKTAIVIPSPCYPLSYYG